MIGTTTKGKDLMQRMESSGKFVFPSHEAQYNSLCKQTNKILINQIKAKGQGTHCNSVDSEKLEVNGVKFIM